MNRTVRFLLLLLVAVTVLTLIPLAVSADGVADGWTVDEDGKQRYYKDGEYLTGVQTIGEFPYVFAEDGEYLGVYDSHTGVGEVGKMNTQAYRDALKAHIASGGKVYSHYNMESSETFTDKDFKNPLTLGTKYGSATAQGSVLLRGKVDGIFTSGPHMLVVHRYNYTNSVERADGGSALVIRSGVTAAHSYSDVGVSAPVGADVVVEAEFMISEDFSSNNTLFQLLDRNNPDTNGSYFLNVLSVNKNGGVYIPGDTSKLLCVLGDSYYTRISVAFRLSENKFDVYVNGVKVADGAKLIADPTVNKPANTQVEWIRTCQFNSVGTGSIYVDNYTSYSGIPPVCTVNAEPKNGIMLEGGVLRYYRDNCIAVGTNTVSGTAGKYTFNGEKVNFGTIDGTGAYAAGGRADIVINGVVSSSAVVPGNVFVAPAATYTDKGVFGGWKVTDGASTTLLAPGQIYEMKGDITCEAVEMTFDMLEGASVKTLSADGTTLRFMAKIGRAEYDALIAAGAKVEAHMIVVPTEYFDSTHGYHTVEALKKSGFTDYVDVTANSWYATNDNAYYFTASTGDISVADYAKEYSAVAYLIITYPNGAVDTVYASYSERANSRSVYRVAHAAYNDRILKKGNDSYANSITYNEQKTYSPYNAERLSVIKAYADKVVTVAASGDAVKPAGDFYDAPYTIVTSFNSATGKNDIAIESKDGWSMADALCVVYNGRVLSEDEYVMDGVCSFSVNAISHSTTALSLESEVASSWYLINPISDSALFTGVINDPTYLHPDQSANVVLEWKYGGKSSISVNPASTPKLGLRGAGVAYTARNESGTYYYDFSDWKALSFFVWSDIDNQTFQFNFGSENPQSDGSDYYGKNFRLNAGWNYFSVSRSEFGANRNPLGWDKINNINITKDGWSQNNDIANIVYFSEFRVYDSEVVASPVSDPRLESAAVFAVGGYNCGVNGIQYKTSLSDHEATAFIENGVYYVPIAPVADTLGYDGICYSEEGAITFGMGASTYYFKSGVKKYTKDDAKVELAYAPISRNGALFVSVDDMMSIFGYTQKYIDRMGLIVLSDTENILDDDADYDLIYSIIEEFIYVRPSGEQIVTDLNAHSGGKHPYLMVDGEGFESLRYYLDMDPTMQAYVKKLEGTYGIGTSRFNAAVNRYKLPDGVRLLSISRDVMNKTVSWALLAKLYEVSDPEVSKQYAERIWDELEAACNFKDPDGFYSWHPAHFLDTAELAYPVAICYDWLYDYWAATASDLDTEQYEYDEGTTRLSLLEDSLYWMSLSVSNVLPSDTTGKYIQASYSIAGSTNNWNGVCNGGLMA
ncbi:MAG: hypothetical protein IJY04_05285, partial [Clostridia bacterium]|nr:hypothetical protein [Clostridia bacterium]